jgi:hypothetical protein
MLELLENEPRPRQKPKMEVLLVKSAEVLRELDVFMGGGGESGVASVEHCNQHVSCAGMCSKLWLARLVDLRLSTLLLQFDELVAAEKDAAALETAEQATEAGGADKLVAAGAPEDASVNGAVQEAAADATAA